DSAGNTTSCSFDVTVLDVENPSISCPFNINTTASSASGAVVNYTSPVGTDNCSGATTTMVAGLASGSTFPIGITTVTHKVTDASGNFAECSFDVIVSGVAPSIVCPSNITQNNEVGVCGANVTFTATETVGIPASTITYSRPPGSYFQTGTTQVTATATNVIGTSSCTFDVTVTDNEVPNVVTQNITVALDVNGSATIIPQDIDNGSSDNCGIDNLSIDITSFDCNDVGSVCDKGSALDFDGVNDYARINNPYYSFTDEITVSWWVNFRDGDPMKSNWMGQSASGVDNMSTNVWLMHPNNLNSYGIIFYVNDNGTWRTAAVTGTPGWHLVTGVADQSGIRVYLDGVLKSSGTGISSGIKNNSNSILDIGKDPRYSPSGVRVANMQADEISVWNRALSSTEIGDLMTNCLAGNENGLVGYWQLNEGSGTNFLDLSSSGATGVLTSTMNASTDWVVSGAGVAAGSASNVVTLTVIDINGNSATGTANVTVEDNIAPVVVTQNISVQLDANGSVTISPNDIDNGSNDQCGIQKLELDINSFDCTDVGVNTSNNYSIDLNSYRAHLNAGNSAALKMTSQMTMEAWVHPTANYGTYGGIIFNREGEYEMARFGDGYLYWAFANSNPGWAWINTNIYLPFNTWTHIAITYNNGVVNAYQNGSLVSTFNGSGNIGDISPSLNELWIGERPSASQYFIGRIDEARIWNVERSSTELANNYNLTISGSEAGLVGYWPMEDGSGSLISSDYSSSNLDATLVGLNVNTAWVGASPAQSPGQTVTLTATDVNGNSSSGTAMVTVEDNTAPTIACVSIQSKNTDASVCNYTAIGTEFDPVAFADNCSGSLISNDFNTSATLANAVFPKGTTTVIWTVTDASSNTVSCSFDVVVTDNEVPTIACVSSRSKNTDVGVCNYTTIGTEFDPATYADNCPGSTIDNSYNNSATLANAVFPKGTTTVIWTVTDASSN
ncbi:MAG: HYR domain-containing protein, partial [Candidatus Cloacimonetes bacterium]|nr:HYR domain-containing protein [Candidatus Cloacimonadota bacterium]